MKQPHAHTHKQQHIVTVPHTRCCHPPAWRPQPTSIHASRYSSVDAVRAAVGLLRCRSLPGADAAAALCLSAAPPCARLRSSHSCTFPCTCTCRPSHTCTASAPRTMQRPPCPTRASAAANCLPMRRREHRSELRAWDGCSASPHPRRPDLPATTTQRKPTRHTQQRTVSGGRRMHT